MSATPESVFRPRVAAIVAASFAPFVWRAYEFFQAGSMLPVYFALGAACLLALVCLFRVSALIAFTVKLWGGVLVVYGLIRLALGGAAGLDLLPSAHARDASTPVFFAISAGLLLAGIFLVRSQVFRR